MKKNFFTRAVSAFMAVVMVFLMVPINTINIWALDLPDSLPKEFQVTSTDGVVTYNISAANMTYDFYIAARSYIDDNATELAELIGKSFSFTTGGNTYDLSSVYAYKPSRDTWNNTCGAFTGIFNYKVVENGEEKIKHVALVAFRGTDGASDIMTDLDFADEQGYHNGFFNAARNHYNEMIDKVSYKLGDGDTISFSNYLKEMKNGNPDYTMIVTGHSLGGAVANIFTSYWLQKVYGVENTNVVAYTYASPCTCSKATAEANKVDNVFNFVNAYDWVPKVGYGGIDPKIYIKPSVKASGYRQGIDFVYKKGDDAYGSRVPCSFTNHKMSVYSQVKDEVNLYISSKYPEETPPTAEDLLDMPQVEYSAIETGIGRFLELYKPAYEAKKAAAKSLLAGESPHTAIVKAITSFFGIEVESETDKAIERMEAEIQEIHLSINEMQKDIDKIQESIDAMANSIEVAKNKIIDTIEGTDRGNKLSSFTIDYITKLNQVNEDYGNLIDTLESGDETLIKTMYDQLYVSSSELSTYIYQNVTVFSVSGGLTTDPVQKILYEQYLASGLEPEPTEKCQAFITDIYTGYAFSEYCLWLCNTQQVSWIVENDAPSYYNDFSRRTTPKSKVVKEWESFKAEHLAVLETLTAFEAELNDDVRNSSVSHFVSNHSITQQTQLTTSETIIVDLGDSVYLNNIAYKLCNESSATQLNLFDDVQKFSYEVVDGSEFAVVDDSGILTVSDSVQRGHKFTVELRYQPNEEAKNVKVATWKFEIGKEHPWYGQGTEDEPFVIATPDDLKAFVNSKNSEYTSNNSFYFVLLNDINLQGQQLNALSSFKGVLNGCGYSIYGFELNSSSMQDGFINQNYGTIKNLTIGSDSHTYFDVTNYGRTSVKVYREFNEDIGHYYYSGALVGSNSGTIQNCHIKNVYVGCNMHDTNDDQTLYCVIGGLVGWEEGTTEKCSVQNSYILSRTPTRENSGDDNNAFAGGFVGKLDNGNIVDCFSINNSIRAEAIGDGTKSNPSVVCSIACGFAGEMIKGEVQNSFVLGNRIESYAYAWYNHTNGTPCQAAFSYKNGSATLTNCTDDYAAFKEALPNENINWDISGEVPSLNDYVDADVYLTKNNYCIGENFDPSTIWVHLIDKHGNISEERYPYFSYIGVKSFEAMIVEVSAYGNIVKTVNVNIEEHTFDDGEITVPATHFKSGELTKTCTACGATKTEVIEPNSDHVFGDWISLSDGQHYRTCACDETEYATHKWSIGVVTVEPTYTTEGVKTYTCDDCGATKTETIPVVQPEHIPGDINGDGVVNTKDTTRLMRYLAGWDVEVNEEALDVNGDGVVNTKDTTRLMRYLAGWDVEIY